MIAIGFAITYGFVEPAPPSRITIASGPKGGAYELFAERYKTLLAEQGFELDVRATEGSIENLALLEDPESGVDLAFVQGGLASADTLPDLIALGSVCYEPLWLFHKSDLELSDLRDLAGKIVGLGAEGSGTLPVTRRILRECGVEPEVDGRELAPEQARTALLDGELDAAFFVGSPEAPSIAELLNSDAVELHSFRRAPAWQRSLPFLSSVTLYEGVIDPARNLPSSDRVLIAPAATLVARETLHHSLIGLVLDVATVVHSRPGIFEDAGEFPGPRLVDFRVPKEATRFYERGLGFLYRILPFWVASLLDRMKIMLLPALTLLIPLFKLFPPLYARRIRSPLHRRYLRLMHLEERLEKDDAEHLKEKLDALAADVESIAIVPAYASELYDLRMHVDRVRARLRKLHS